MRQLLEQHIPHAALTRTVPKIIEPPAGYELASQPPAKTPAANPNAASDPAAEAAFASTKVERAVQSKPEVDVKTERSELEGATRARKNQAK